MNNNYLRSEPINLKSHPTFNERWLQDLIENDPSILGLGDLFLRDKDGDSLAQGGSICCSKTPRHSGDTS